MASEVGSNLEANLYSSEEEGILEEREAFACGRECATIAPLSAVAFRGVLSSSWFYPSYSQERRIEDRGSIAESIERSSVDLFDRQVIQRNRVGNWLRGLARAVAFVVMGLFAGGAGTVYHARLFETHFFRWLFCKGETASFHWQKIALHGKAVLFDLTLFLCSAIGIFAILSGVREWSLMSVFGGLIWLIPLHWHTILRPSELTDFSPLRRAAAYKSLMLREKYGIVGQDGNLLSWDVAKDVEFHSAYFPDTRGHLGTLFKEEGLLFLKAVSRLQAVLPSHCKMPPMYPPTARAIGYFLDRNQPLLAWSAEEIEGWKKEFQYHENNFKEIGLILQECFSIQFSSIGVTRYLALPSFPIDSLCALSYFE